MAAPKKRNGNFWNTNQLKIEPLWAWLIACMSRVPDTMITARIESATGIS